jgi:Collagen triple helix repeat (20 copies)
MKRLPSKLTYSNVMVTILAFVVLGGGTAYAATQVLPDNSVGSKQVKNGAITPAKLSAAARATLTAAAGPTGPTGATGAQGLSGKEGPLGQEGSLGNEGSPGKEGPIGPSTLYSDTGLPALLSAGAALSVQATVTVPAGVYQVIAAQTVQTNFGGAELDCYIYAGSSREASFFAVLLNETAGLVTGVATITVTAPTEVTDQCQAAENKVIISEPKIVALQVGALG